MGASRLEPGEFPDDVVPKQGADGVWRIPQTWHRAWSGKLVRSSGKGKTRRDCAADFRKSFDRNVNNGGAQVAVASRRRQWATTDLMSDAFEHWLVLQEQKVARGKIKEQSCGDYRRFIYPTGERASKTAPRLDREMGRLTLGQAGRPAFLADYIDAVEAKAPGVARVQHVILRAVFKMATLGGAWDKSPMDMVPQPMSAEGGDQRALLASEVERLPMLWPKVGHGRAQYLRPMILTLLGTGMRPGEARALRWCDIAERDEQGWMIAHINGTVFGDPPIRQDGRKQGDKYWLQLPGWLTAELDDWRQDCRFDDDKDFVFSARTGGALTGTASGRSLINARKGTPLDWLKYPHFRDTVATVVDDFYDNSKRASAQLGHAEGQSIAIKHYIDKAGRTRRVVDNTPALKEFAEILKLGSLTTK
ncbi:site-specific integrase [Nocardia sp. NPDC006630]|uniref:tyrosine-type recombinase/integrase n=1 Tax=Nocardia sp. NPDC006630 TaxID=3157181 RepID=UPI0033B7F7DA